MRGVFCRAEGAASTLWKWHRVPVERFPSPLRPRCQAAPRALSSLSAGPSAAPALASARPHARHEGSGASPPVPALTPEASILPGPQQSHAAPGPSPPGLSFSPSESPPSLQHPKQRPPASTHHITPQPGAAASSSKILLCHRGITLPGCGTRLINPPPHPGASTSSLPTAADGTSRESKPLQPEAPAAPGGRAREEALALRGVTGSSAAASGREAEQFQVSVSDADLRVASVQTRGSAFQAPRPR